MIFTPSRSSALLLSDWKQAVLATSKNVPHWCQWPHPVSQDGLGLPYPALTGFIETAGSKETIQEGSENGHYGFLNCKICLT